MISEKETFAQMAIRFNQQLDFTGNLPGGIKLMNPFKDNSHALEVSSRFYEKFYSDFNPRKLILGINPGRFGAGVTGIPFTDTKRLKTKCGLDWNGCETHETSSVFIYDMIGAYGGVDEFYSDYFINSVSPLGFVIEDKKGREKNCNYYDSKELQKSVEPFILNSLDKILQIGIKRDVCICLGNNKNFKYLKKLNERFGYFEKIIALEHPRYIMQYRLKEKEDFIRNYLEVLSF